MYNGSLVSEEALDKLKGKKVFFRGNLEVLDAVLGTFDMNWDVYKDTSELEMADYNSLLVVVFMKVDISNVYLSINNTLYIFNLMEDSIYIIEREYNPFYNRLLKLDLKNIPLSNGCNVLVKNYSKGNLFTDSTFMSLHQADIVGEDFVQITFMKDFVKTTLKLPHESVVPVSIIEGDLEIKTQMIEVKSNSDRIYPIKKMNRFLTIGSVVEVEGELFVVGYNYISDDGINTVNIVRVCY